MGLFVIRTVALIMPCRGSQHSKQRTPHTTQLVASQQTELFTNLMEATPPRDDPIYTEMIGTLGLFGTFYMSKEDMDFCAMRLYSNFKQAQVILTCFCFCFLLFACVLFCPCMYLSMCFSF